MPDPRFTAIVPAYNSEETIGETISSILGQTVEDLELIVVDDGSSDSTPQVIEGFAERDSRMRVITQENGGTAAARNTGIAAARAPLVAFLDDDDLWMPNYLEALGSALDREPRADFAHPNARVFAERTGRIRRQTSFEMISPPASVIDAAQLLERLIELNFIMSSSMCRRSALLEVGELDTSLRGTDDWDLWLRLAHNGHTCVRVDEPVLLQRDRPDSQSKNEVVMLRSSVAVLEKVGSDPTYPKNVRDIALRRREEQLKRIDQVDRGALIDSARRARRRVLATRDQHLHQRDWLAEVPEDVAETFPSIAARYGLPASKLSNRSTV